MEARHCDCFVRKQQVALSASFPSTASPRYLTIARIYAGACVCAPIEGPSVPCAHNHPQPSPVRLCVMFWQSVYVSLQSVGACLDQSCTDHANESPCTQGTHAREHIVVGAKYLVQMDTSGSRLHCYVAKSQNSDTLRILFERFDAPTRYRAQLPGNVRASTRIENRPYCRNTSPSRSRMVRLCRNESGYL